MKNKAGIAASGAQTVGKLLDNQNFQWGYNWDIVRKDSLPESLKEYVPMCWGKGKDPQRFDDSCGKGLAAAFSANPFKHLLG